MSMELVSALRAFATQVRNFKNDPGMLLHLANEMDKKATAYDPRYPVPQEPEEEPEPEKEPEVETHKPKAKAKKKK